MTVENLESLGLPEFGKAALLPEKVPTHDATQKLIHQDIVEDDSAADDLSFGQGSLPECAVCFILETYGVVGSGRRSDLPPADGMTADASSATQVE
jgi:hypothetical protein